MPQFNKFTEEPPADIPPTAIDSELLQSWGYSAKTQTLAVVFKRSLDAWDYADVPPEIAREMQNARSKGAYFVNYIRGKFAGKLVRKGMGGQGVAHDSRKG